MVIFRRRWLLSALPPQGRNMRRLPFLLVRVATGQGWSSATPRPCSWRRGRLVLLPVVEEERGGTWFAPASSSCGTATILRWSARGTPGHWAGKPSPYVGWREVAVASPPYRDALQRRAAGGSFDRQYQREELGTRDRGLDQGLLAVSHQHQAVSVLAMFVARCGPSRSGAVLQRTGQPRSVCWMP